MNAFTLTTLVATLLCCMLATAKSWEVPCHLGKEIYTCEDFCSHWKKYPPKENIGICVRGCKTAYDGMKIGYQRKFPSLEIRHPHCNSWWKKLHGLPVTPYTKEASNDGCKKVQIAFQNCMVKQQRLFPEKFEEEEEEEEDGDDEEDGDVDDDDTGTTQTSGAATMSAHRSMQDQLSGFKKR